MAHGNPVKEELHKMIQIKALARAKVSTRQRGEIMDTFIASNLKLEIRMKLWRFRGSPPSGSIALKCLSGTCWVAQSWPQSRLGEVLLS